MNKIIIATAALLMASTSNAAVTSVTLKNVSSGFGSLISDDVSFDNFEIGLLNGVFSNEIDFVLDEEADTSIVFTSNLANVNVALNGITLGAPQKVMRLSEYTLGAGSHKLTFAGETVGGIYGYNLAAHFSPVPRVFLNTGTTVVPDNTNISAAPEASTWAMMILGFGLVGVSARARFNKKLAVR